MKQRILIVIPLMLFILIISSCGTAETSPIPQGEATAESPPEPVNIYEPGPVYSSSTELTDAMAEFPCFSPERTSAMSSWAGYGFGIVEEDVYYGRFFLKDDRSPILFSIELESRNNDVSAGQWRILDNEHSPKYLIKQDDVLYYIMLDRNTGKSIGIAKVCTDGSGRQVLYEGSCDYLSKAGGRLFFTDGGGRPMSISEDGNELRVIADRETYYLYAINEDWLIFHDDIDKESLHLFCISDGIDIKLNDSPSFYPLISGASLFFAVPYEEDSSAFRLACIDLRSYGERYDENEKCFFPVFTVQYGDKLFGGEFCIIGSTIRSLHAGDAVDIDNWKDVEDTAYSGFSRTIRFISDRWIVEEIIGNDGGITAMMFHDRVGGFASRIPWLS